LIALTEEPGALRTKEELLAPVWPDLVVDESSLFILRKGLGDSDGQWIITAGVSRHCPLNRRDV
jgi:DNA-binding winged helix-turn-helix (wHTH) protein